MKVTEKQFKKLRWIVLLFTLSVTTIFGLHLANVTFDSNFEHLFSEEDEETQYFHDFRNDFSPENDYLLLVIENEDGIFEHDFIHKVTDFTDDISVMANVVEVMSLTNQKERFFSPAGIPSVKPYIDLLDFNPLRDSIRVFQKHELQKTLVGDDGKSLCLFIRYQDYLDEEKIAALIEEVQENERKYEFQKTRMFGKIYGQQYITQKMQKDLGLFLGIGFGLIFVFLLLTFRSAWGIILPQIVILLGLIWLLGGLGLVNEPLNILLTVMPTIMLVVSMSDVIHFTVRYRDLLVVKEDAFEAIMQTIREVGTATFLTSLTTAIGFYSLYFINIRPIQVFGIVLGSGVIIAFLVTFLLLPILFYWFPGKVKPSKSNFSDKWESVLEKIYTYTLRNKNAVLGLSLFLFIVFGFGSTLLNANNYSMPDLDSSDPFAQDMNYINEHYGGVRSFVLTVTLEESDQNFWNLKTLSEIDKVHSYLEAEYGVTIRSSLVQLIKIMNRGLHDGDQMFYALPDSRKDLMMMKRGIQDAQQGALVRNYLNEAGNGMQINGFMNDCGSTEALKRNRELFAFIAKEEMQGLTFRLTGTAHLVDKNIQFLVENMMLGLGLSIIVVALLIGFIFKSFRILLISLVPNVLPLVIIAGTMGFLGIELKMATVIIFSIAYGIVVDDTIHFLGKFKYELRQGKGKLEALKSCYVTTGKAMILTTIVLCSGFFLMIFSSFVGTFYLGLLLCLSLFSALLADLFLLPVLLSIFYKND